MLLEKLKQYKSSQNLEAFKSYLNSLESIKAADLVQKDPELLRQDPKIRLDALTYASAWLDRETYQALIAKVSFVEKLRLYLFYPEILRSYLAKVSSISKAELTELNESRVPALIYASTILIEQDYKLLIDKIETHSLEEIILQEPDCGLAVNVALAVAELGSAKALLDKISRKFLNMLACKPNILSLLHIGAKSLDQEGFLALLSKISTEVLNHLLPIQNDQGETVMHLAARHQGAKAYQALEERAYLEAPEAYKKAMMTQDKEGWSGFTCVMIHQGGENLQNSILKLGGLINQAIQLKTYEKRNRRPSGTPEIHKQKFAAWIGKNSRQSCYSSNGLHLAAQFLDSKSFRVLISSLSRTALNKALNKRDFPGRTPLQIADRYQDREAVELLLFLADPLAIQTARISDALSGYKWTKPQIESQFPSVVSRVSLQRNRTIADEPERDIMPFLREISREWIQEMSGNTDAKP